MENGDHAPAQDQVQAPPADAGDGAGATTSKKLRLAEKRKDKKVKQKQNKQLRRQQQQERQASNSQAGAASATTDEGDEDIVIEYVSAPLELEGLSLNNGDGAAAAPPAPEEEEHMGLGSGYGFDTEGANGNNKAPKEDILSEFRRVFEKFASAEQVTGAAPLGEEGEEEAAAAAQKGEKAEGKADAKAKDADDADDEDGSGEGGTGPGGKKMTKKERKAALQLKIAELKRQCDRPDVVEVWDVTAQDPRLLVFLKAYRNTVPVPRHWSQKRKYLQGKRGLEKPPFQLPDFIEATGIGKMRQAYSEKEDTKKLKNKSRERMQPKMGRMDIDYQVLHDAFFKYQTRPKLSFMGELYYEGKEFEARIEGLKPGHLSPDLKAALGMADKTSPPPWLINMQRYGPPPSYPNLRIPGLNAPIPNGCQFGYQPGGWGKPPVDEVGNPLYGDVFAADEGGEESDVEVDKAVKWGELEPDLEESSEEEEEQEEKEEEDEDALADGIASGLASGMVSGMVSGMASGIASSLPSGIETPDVSINLRKGSDSVVGEAPRPLYQVLEQKAASIGQSTLLGTDHVYVMPAGATGVAPPLVAGAAGAAGKKGGPAKPGAPAVEVEVTLSPEEMEGLDAAGIKALYDEKVAEAKSGANREDFSDLVAARAAQQKRKLAQKQDASKKAKTSDFKF